MQVVCGIIKKNNKFLIAKRGKGVDAGFWEFPGGKVEIGESKEEALIREIKEELKLDVQVISYLCTIEDYHHTEPIIVSAYLCEYKKGKMTLHVHDEGCWVSVKELLNYSFQEADAPILKQLKDIYDK